MPTSTLDNNIARNLLKLKLRSADVGIGMALRSTNLRRAQQVARKFRSVSKVWESQLMFVPLLQRDNTDRNALESKEQHASPCNQHLHIPRWADTTHLVYYG